MDDDDVVGPSGSGRYVFDTTKTNYRSGNIPEIGSTIYNTIPTGGDTFLDRSSDNERRTRSGRRTGLEITHAKSFNVSQSGSGTQLSGNEVRSGSISRRRKMKRKNEVDDKNSLYADFMRRRSYNRRSDDYYENMFRCSRNHRIKKSKSRFRLRPRRKSGVSLYDGTDSLCYYTSLSSRNMEESTEDEATPGTATSSLDISDRKKSEMERQNARLRTALTTDEKPQCFLQLPISVITEQCIRVTSTIRQSLLHSTIYIFSANEMGHCNIAQLDEMLIGAPIMNRETNETEWDKRPLNFKEDIFVKNNIIKIRRSTLFRNLQNGKEVIRNDRRTYNNLCPAEVTNAVQREIYGNMALKPQSMLNITSVYGEQRSINGNIRLIEKLIITLSSGKEPHATQRLQKQIEERIIEPENYDIPIRYVEEVLIGPRRIDISREAEINPREGLSEFMTAREPHLFEFGEVRRYSNFVLSTSQSRGGTQSDFPIQRSSSLSPVTDGQIRQTKETTPRQFSFREFKQLKSAKVTDEQEKEQIPPHKIQSVKLTEMPIIRGVNDSGVPIIDNISDSPVSTKQKKLDDSAKDGKTDLWSKKLRLLGGLRRSSRWSRFAPAKSPILPASTESIPVAFSPLKTSTPVRKHPKTAENLDERNKFSMDKYVKTSRSQSSGTGTHIRSTLDCDITLRTTNVVNVTEIPIEINGMLNDLPWCTTIRLRVKHDANEKPTFIPNRCKIS
ncbi:unnamed protein product [Acanthocheilonema viteae]|uniref:Uncharacterized protein n=1 Tax=Acanthocheilonema viteae TaxID=6277 RepID=A0A498S311_ACAVI|nr:unnamed protein product [Acanthocheilonema viteae]